MKLAGQMQLGRRFQVMRAVVEKGKNSLSPTTRTVKESADVSAGGESESGIRYR